MTESGSRLTTEAQVLYAEWEGIVAEREVAKNRAPWCEAHGDPMRAHQYRNQIALFDRLLAGLRRQFARIAAEEAT